MANPVAVLWIAQENDAVAVHQGESCARVQVISCRDPSDPGEIHSDNGDRTQNAGRIEHRIGQIQNGLAGGRVRSDFARGKAMGLDNAPVMQALGQRNGSSGGQRATQKISAWIH
jgi:hypothetical protein